MTQEQKRIAVAEACGIKSEKYVHRTVWIYNGMMNAQPPNYPGCLNALHEAEKHLKPNEGVMFRSLLWRFTDCREMPDVEGEPKSVNGEAHKQRYVSAGSERRFEAFGIAKGLWKEGE